MPLKREKKKQCKAQAVEDPSQMNNTNYLRKKAWIKLPPSPFKVSP